MASSLISGLSGLRTHQNWIDVIGNNLANASTPGFKSSRALFADMISRDLRSATAPTGTLGGTNPVQVGLGVDVGHIDRDFNQGALNITGRTFDLALDGRGFFAVTDGVQTLYTRVGTFGLDAANNMVDLRSGHRVLSSSGGPFTVNLDAVVPPSATTSMSFAGNLPAEVKGPLAEVLTTASAFAEGTAAQLTGASAEPFAIPSGQTFSMELIVNGGAPQTVSVTSTTGSVTATDVANAINTLDHVTAAVVGGAVQLSSDRSGTSSTIKVNPGPVGQDLAGVLGMPTALVAGTETAAGLTTDLNDLTGNLSDYATGDVIEIAASGVTGTPIQATFEYGIDGTTVGDLVTFINAQFAGATAAFNAGTGQISLSADATGESELSLTLLDGSSQAGASAWAAHSFGVTTEGTGPDTATSSIEVFDAAGTAHLLSFTYERQDDGTWDLTSTVDPTEGTVTAGSIAGITFNPNGSIATPSSGQVTVQFNGQAAQTITVDLGTPGLFEGITQFGSPKSVLADSQDGFGAGELSSLQVSADGTIQGFYTNGELQDLGQFGVATFANDHGLSDAGNNFWLQTANTGTVVLSGGNVGAAGVVTGGAIEESNVDTAQEFVRMIQAQRGFQANARVISIQDELLNETVNLI
jgi:flagellar hook protein FlgE